ncbi:MAG: hypothetical protein ACRELV_12390, partial [Longimicrobiales bacterium]
MMEPQSRVEQPTRSGRAKRALWMAAAIVVAFLAGFLWQYMVASGAQAELASTQRQLTFQRLESTLAAAAIAAHRGTFESARRLASDFYTGLQQSAGGAPTEASDELRAILAERDATITLLSRSDPRASEVLDQQYVRLRIAIGGPERAMPLG